MLSSPAGTSAAIAACVHATGVIDAAMRRFANARLAAVEDWVGPHRQNYDDAVSRLTGAAADAVAAIDAVRRRLVDEQAEARATLLTRGPF